MQNNKFIDDFTKVMTSAVNAAFDARKQFEENMKRQAERTMGTFGFIAREEFDVVKDMASKARKENDTLKNRIEELEKKLTAASKAAKAAPAKPADAPKQQAPKQAPKQEVIRQEAPKQQAIKQEAARQETTAPAPAAKQQPAAAAKEPAAKQSAKQPVVIAIRAPIRKTTAPIKG